MPPAAAAVAPPARRTARIHDQKCPLTVKLTPTAAYVTARVSPLEGHRSAAARPSREAAAGSGGQRLTRAEQVLVDRQSVLFGDVGRRTMTVRRGPVRVVHAQAGLPRGHGRALTTFHGLMSYPGPGGRRLRCGWSFPLHGRLPRLDCIGTERLVASQQARSRDAPRGGVNVPASRAPVHR